MSKKIKTLGKLFDRRQKVFGVHVFGTSEVKDYKFDHAANVLRDYLDSNGDGKADSKKLVKSLKREKAVLTVFSDDDQLENFLSKHERKFEKVNANFQDLLDDEIVTAFDKSNKFDASLEEVFHLISDYGYSEIYPKQFGKKKDSVIGGLMNEARGGYFKKVPDNYPEEAYFTYDDKSCDYECQITEYFYWGMTSILGAQQSPGRLEQIQGEWRLNTPAKVEERDPELFDLLSNPKFGLPTILPDGLS